MDSATGSLLLGEKTISTLETVAHISTKGPHDKEPPRPQRPGWVWFPFHLLQGHLWARRNIGWLPFSPPWASSQLLCLDRSLKTGHPCVLLKCVHLSNNFLVPNFKNSTLSPLLFSPFWFLNWWNRSPEWLTISTERTLSAIKGVTKAGTLTLWEVLQGPEMLSLSGVLAFQIQWI